MADSAQTVTVRILEKEYQVACPADEVDSLTQSAKYLDQCMAEIKNSGKVVGLDRIAVMAALNITHEFLSHENSSSEANQEVTSRLDRLRSRVGRRLGQSQTT